FPFNASLNRYATSIFGKNLSLIAKASANRMGDLRDSLRLAVSLFFPMACAISATPIFSRAISTRRFTYSIFVGFMLHLPAFTHCAISWLYYITHCAKCQYYFFQILAMREKCRII